MVFKITPKPMRIEEEIKQKVGIQFRMTELILLEGEILIGIKNNLGGLIYYLFQMK